VRVLLSITPFVVGCVLTACASIPLERTGYRVIAFDEAMKNQLNRSIPLKLAFPEEYAMLALYPATQGVIWAMPADLAEIEKAKAAPPAAGIFHGRLTSNVIYDKAKKSFCGPSCDESDTATQFKKAGLGDARTERYEVNGIPILLMEVDTSAVNGSGRNRVYMAYIGTLIDTKVMLISYRPPSNSNDDGVSVWESFKKALTESK
jgi:hypothetical protein